MGSVDNNRITIPKNPNKCIVTMDPSTSMNFSTSKPQIASNIFSKSASKHRILNGYP